MANSPKLRKAKETLYANLVERTIRAIAKYMGLNITQDLLDAMFKATKPLIDQGRVKAQAIAFQDYLAFIDNKDPVKRIPLNRFTDELWKGSLAKVAPVGELLSNDVAADIGLRADLWARDAEWGQRTASAKSDPRIGKVARVDFEPPTCPLCTLLNSRGAVYISMESASRTLHVGDTCDLVFVAAGATDYPGSAHTAEALNKYTAAVKRTPSGTTNEVLAELKSAGSSTQGPGRVKKAAHGAASNTSASKLADAQHRIRALESYTPKSDSARAYHQKQLESNRLIVQALSPGGPQT